MCEDPTRFVFPMFINSMVDAGVVPLGSLHFYLYNRYGSTDDLMCLLSMVNVCGFSSELR